MKTKHYSHYYYLTASFLTGIFIISLGGSAAYAERSTIEVPFDFNGLSCNFDQDAVQYTCIWQGSTETVTKEAIYAQGEISEEQLAEERKIAHELAEAEERAVLAGPKLTAEQQFIAILNEKLEKGTISTADAILLKALEDKKRICEVGVEHGELVQTYTKYDLPENDPDTYNKAIDYGKNVQLGNVIKEIQACEHWDDYRYVVLGQRYLDIIVDDSTTQRYHAAVAATDDKYPHERLTDESFAAAQQKALDYMCNVAIWDMTTKKQQGCVFEKAPITNTITRSPFDDDPAYKRYQQYMSTGGTAVDLDTLKKHEEDKIRQQSLESFALQHNIDVADLKNLVNPVDEYNEDKANP